LEVLVWVGIGSLAIIVILAIILLQRILSKTESEVSVIKKAADEVEEEIESK